jgi:16S rRNA (cytosine967-C5)-methyltransferase
VANVSPARRAAFRILLAVERDQAHADDLLRGDAVDALSPADRNLTTALVLGALRWQMLLDEQIKAFLTRPGAKLDLEVLAALRLAAFQLLSLDRIPAHAAISESVELVKQAGHRFASGMVNAVLRKIAGGSHTDLSKSVVQSHPAWLVERWSAHYGREAACAICEHGQTQPVMSVRLQSPAVEAELTRDRIQLEPGNLLTSARIIISGDVTAIAAFREGRARIQDEGSQLIAEIAACAGESLRPRVKGILDTCAAPGGKTLILAERNLEARIVACEASPRRFAQMRERLTPYAGQIDCRLMDATQLDEVGVFDLALADVPCSGTGTLGRNPEIRYRLHAEDLSRHAERQKEILRAAIRAVRPGGMVVYSTCSLEPEENELVIADVVANTSGVRTISLGECLHALAKNGVLAPNSVDRLRACLTPQGALRLLPGTLHTDGFFVAVLEKSI